MKSTIKIIALVLIMPFYSAEAQTVFPDATMEKDFQAYVKTVEEFINRFNGDAYHPEIGEGRQSNLIALCDFQMSHDSLSENDFRKHIQSFVQYIDSNNVQIHLHDSPLYAELEVEATVMGQDITLSLILQNQTYVSGEIRWGIVGCKGMQDFTAFPILSHIGLSPVDHDLHFMGIGNIFSGNVSSAMCFRGRDVKVDYLTMLLTLAVCDKVRIRSTGELTMHCLEVPGYVFTINEQGREGMNSGWLISSITIANDTDKSKYLISLLGQ